MGFLVPDLDDVTDRVLRGGDPLLVQLPLEGAVAWEDEGDGHDQDGGDAEGEDVAGEQRRVEAGGNDCDGAVHDLRAGQPGGNAAGTADDCTCTAHAAMMALYAALPSDSSGRRINIVL